MNRERALVQILFGTPHERLMAARELTRSAIPEDMQTIERASQKETVLWTKTAIGDILRRLRNEDKPPEAPKMVEPATTEVSDEYVKDLYANAIREATGSIIHEIQPLIGSLQIALEKEVPNFEGSRSLQKLQSLREMLRTIGELRSAATAPTFQQFDLAELVKTVCDEVSIGTTVPVQLAGAQEFIIVGDRGRLKMALANGLRNGIEATLAVDEAMREPVIITWSSRQNEFWIAVLDSGRGLSGDPSRTFQIGTTTKSGHLGMGLPVAKQAIHSIGGEIVLSNRQPQGARLELRWPKYNLTEARSEGGPN